MVKRGGYILLHRALDESEIMDKPPHYLKIFIHLLINAEWKDRKKKGYKLKRGQCLTSYKELLLMLRYKAGNRIMTFTPRQIDRAMAWLRQVVSVVSRKVAAGMIVTIVNYEEYQLKEYPEGGAEGGTAGGTAGGDLSIIEEVISNKYGKIPFPKNFPIEKFAFWEVERRKNNKAPKMTDVMRRTALTQILDAGKRGAAFRGIGYNSISELLEAAAENRWRGFSWLKAKLNTWENNRKRFNREKDEKSQARPQPPEFKPEMMG